MVGCAAFVGGAVGGLFEQWVSSVRCAGNFGEA